MSDAHESLTEDSFDLLEYLSTGTVARRQVVIYADVEAGDLLVSTLDQLRALGWDEEQDPGDSEPSDGPLSDADDEPSPEVAELLQVAEAAQERLEASRSVWTVRALSDEEREEALSLVPEPKLPLPPKDNAPEQLREKFAKRAQQYGIDKVEADRKRKVVRLAMAIESIERPGVGAVSSVTVETLEALRSKPHGSQWIAKLAAALDDAQNSDPSVPRPTSLGRSTSTQD